MNHKSWAALRPFLWAGLRLMLYIALLALTLALPLTGAEAESASQPSLTAEEQALAEAYRTGQIIRLHILADNDSPEAQRLKLKVRDALLAAFGRRLEAAGAVSADQVFQLLEQSLSQMSDVAEECARQNGFAGSVTLEAGTLRLPEKRYGGVTLPQGDYRGLRVVIGSGQGRNWWCILFPELCLALADSEPWQTAPDAFIAEGAPADAGASGVASPRAEEAVSEPCGVYWASEKIFANWIAAPFCP